MSWTPEDREGDAEVSVWMHHQRRLRRKKMLIAGGLALASLLVTWMFSGVMSITARSAIEYEQWLKDNGCRLTSKKDSKTEYHFFGDYWEYTPGEACYKCSKTGKSFCEEI